MKFLFVIVITNFLVFNVSAQCPTNSDTSVEVKKNKLVSEVIVKFDQGFDDISEFNVIKFGSGNVEDVVIRKKNKKEYNIEGLESGEYMIQIIGKDCTTYVGTDNDYHGFIIK